MFTLKNVHLSSNSYNFWAQPNITTKLAQCLTWTFLCKQYKFGEKIIYNSRYIEFFLGVYFFGAPCRSSQFLYRRCVVAVWWFVQFLSITLFLSEFFVELNTRRCSSVVCLSHIPAPSHSLISVLYRNVLNYSLHSVYSHNWLVLDLIDELFWLIADAEPPEITCPQNVDVTVSGWDDVMVTLRDAIGQPSVADNSGNVSWRVGGLNDNWTFAIGHWPLTYEARDPAGNTANCTQYIHVKGRLHLHWKSLFTLTTLTVWRRLLPYGYNYKVSCDRPG